MKRRNFIGLGSTVGILASAIPALSMSDSVKAEKNEKRYQHGASPWPI
jgi:hypothetical protein